MITAKILWFPGLPAAGQPLQAGNGQLNPCRLCLSCHDWFAATGQTRRFRRADRIAWTIAIVCLWCRSICGFCNAVAASRAFPLAWFFVSCRAVNACRQGCPALIPVSVPAACKTVPSTTALDPVKSSMTAVIVAAKATPEGPWCVLVMHRSPGTKARCAGGIVPQT